MHLDHATEVSPDIAEAESNSEPISSPAALTSPRQESFHPAPTLDLPPAAALAHAPRGFTTRRIPSEWLGCLIRHRAPRAGDLVLARVTALGQHTRLHLPNGRRQDLFEGDEILLAYGHRYASDQFEAEVPTHLGPCHLAASGGLAGVVIQAHRSMRRPTTLLPLGLVARQPDGPPINLADAALPAIPWSNATQTAVIAVVGTAMNAGKTTSAAQLTRGLTRAGYRVAYLKPTGTSAGGDPWLLADAGAVVTFDCADAGFATTYRTPLPALHHACASLLAHASRAQVDVILVEIADGVLQAETAALLEGKLAREHFRGVVLAASDAMGAGLGTQWLRHRGLRVLAVTGTLTNSPLQVSEAQAITRCAVLPTPQLAAPLMAQRLLNQAVSHA